MRPNLFERLSPVGPEYARLPILQAFNWGDCLADVDAGQWYIVAFRSIRRETADPARLKALDDLAYEEALREPGLLLYFRGSMNERRECLSICVWQSQAMAEAATRLPSHQAAADLTDEMYAIFELERWILTKHSGAGVLEIAPVRVDAARASIYASAATQMGGSFWMFGENGVPGSPFPEGNHTSLTS